MTVATAEKVEVPEIEVTKELREETLDKIIVARVGLLLRHPFLGNMATRLILKEATDWCPTAATDGKHLFYSVPFFAKMSNKEVEFVIAHEILHCVYDHMTRREDRDPQIHNIAADYIVNNTLVRDGIGEKPRDIPIFQDFKYDGWTSEAVYDDIYKKYDEEELKQLGKLLDEHIDWDKDSKDNQSKNGAKGKKGNKPSYSKEELSKIRDQIKENMISAAQAAGAGNVPKEVERMIKELTEPKMTWRELLRTQIPITIKNDFTFQRPSRKAWHTGVIMPGMKNDETIDICIALDMSGSIGDLQAKDFLSEIQGIMQEYKDYNIKVWCFDTKVYNEQDFSADNGMELEDYQIMGGGGTDFMANWDYMKEQGIVPKRFIMFTDGMPWDSWGDENYCDTVFVIHSHYDKNTTAPFGVTAHYEEA